MSTLSTKLKAAFDAKQNIVTFNTDYDSSANKAATMSDINAALTSVLTYKGTIGSSNATVTTLPASHKIGDVYVVSVAGTYAGKACEVGDYIICNTAGETASDSHWDIVNGENLVSNNSATLSWGNTSTIGTVDGTSLTITMPEKPTSVESADSVEWSNVENTPTTISGYGITDAKIEGKTITLGGNSVTVLDSSSTLDATKLSGTVPSSSYTNTTYTLIQDSTDGHKITFTPSTGSATTITIPDNDTHYKSINVVGGSKATSNTTTTLSNGNVYLNSVENNAYTSGIKISGSGGSEVTATSGGNIVITSPSVSINQQEINLGNDSIVVPVVTDTYSTTSVDGMSGIAVASALDPLEANIGNIQTDLSTAQNDIYNLQQNDSDLDTSIETNAEDIAVLQTSNANKLDLIINIGYNDLVEKITNSLLIPGQKYRIINYVTAVTATGAKSALHLFDLIVVAINNTELSCKALAIQHEGDTYFSNSDLSKWEIWYDINNDIYKYDWIKENATSSLQITTIIEDEEYTLDYDLTITVNGINYYSWIPDTSLPEATGYSAYNVSFLSTNSYSIGDNLHLYDIDEKEIEKENYSTITSLTENRGAIYRMIDEFGNDCPYDFKNILFARYYLGDLDTEVGFNGYYSFSSDKRSLRLFSTCLLDTSTSKWCYTFSDNLNSSSDSSDLSLVGSDNWVRENVIKPYLSEGSKQLLNNICLFGVLTYSNKFGNDCRSITLNGSNCNIFGSNIYCILGNTWAFNLIKDSCNYITANANFNLNIINSGCTYLRINAYCLNSVIDSGNQYMDLVSATEASTSNLLKNIHVHSGVNNSRSTTPITIPSDMMSAAHVVNVGKTTDGTLKIYNEDDASTSSSGSSGIENIVAASGSNINTTGTPTVTSSTSGTTTTLTFNYLKGASGDRGSRITVGTVMTGKYTTGTIYSSSGITDALVDDIYINSSTYDVYKCTVAGAASVAKWAYQMNIQGAAGSRGASIYTGTAITGQATSSAGFSTGLSNIAGDLYINTSTFYMYKCVNAGTNTAAAWSYIGTLGSGSGGTTLTLTLDATTKSYLTGTTNTSTGTASNLNFDTSCYLDTVAGRIHSTTMHTDGVIKSSGGFETVNNKGITSEDANGDDANIMYIDSDNNFVLGAGTLANTIPSYLRGDNVYIQTRKQTGSNALMNAVMIGTGGSTRFYSDVTLNLDPTSNLHAATKLYVDSKIDAKTYNVFEGSTTTDAGVSGLVPAPTTDDSSNYLCGDGTWKTLPIQGNILIVDTLPDSPESGVIYLVLYNS